MDLGNSLALFPRPQASARLWIPDSGYSVCLVRSARDHTLLDLGSWILCSPNAPWRRCHGSWILDLRRALGFRLDGARAILDLGSWILRLLSSEGEGAPGSWILDLGSWSRLGSNGELDSGYWILGPSAPWQPTLLLSWILDLTSTAISPELSETCISGSPGAISGLEFKVAPPPPPPHSFGLSVVWPHRILDPGIAFDCQWRRPSRLGRPMCGTTRCEPPGRLAGRYAARRPSATASVRRAAAGARGPLTSAQRPAPPTTRSDTSPRR